MINFSLVASSRLLEFGVSLAVARRAGVYSVRNAAKALDPDHLPLPAIVYPLYTLNGVLQLNFEHDGQYPHYRLEYLQSRWGQPPLRKSVAHTVLTVSQASKIKNKLRCLSIEADRARRSLRSRQYKGTGNDAC